MMKNKKEINTPDLEHLISRLKTEDSRYASISKAIQIVYWVLIPVYMFTGYMTYRETNDLNHVIGGLFFIASYIIFAVFFGNYYKEYKYVDYSLPTIKMLKNAAYRYKPFQRKVLWIVLAIFLMDAGLSFTSAMDLSVMEIQFLFLGLMVLSVFIGLLVWYYKYKPLRDNALELIREIEAT